MVKKQAQPPKREPTFLERMSLKLTRSIGSTKSLIVHSIFFIIMILLPFLGVDFDKVLLILTTVVSLEAIYLAIFIQMSVNRQGRRLLEVSHDIEEIQEDVEEIQEDVEGIEKDVDEIQKDVDEIQEDVDEIQEDVEEIEVVKIKGTSKNTSQGHPEILEKIQHVLEALAKDVEALKNKEK